MPREKDRKVSKSEKEKHTNTIKKICGLIENPTKSDFIEFIFFTIFSNSE